MNIESFSIPNSFTGHKMKSNAVNVTRTSSLFSTILIDSISSPELKTSLKPHSLYDKTTSPQGTATQKQADSSCDCDSRNKPCKCDIHIKKAEVSEDKKSGIAACMECPNRTNGQCDMWNRENEDSIFNLLSVTSNNGAMRADVAKILDIQTNLDVIAKASSDYDYTNAYTYLGRKIKNSNIK